MRDIGGKSGRRPGRHLQVEASGPGNAAGVQQRLAGRFRGDEVAQGRACAVWLKVDAPELPSGPGWKIQEVSRVGAQGVTSKSKLLAREMPDLHNRGLRADPGAVRWLKGARAGRRVDRRRLYASVRPEWKMQEESRVGAQGVTSKSKLLAREMPRVCSRGVRVDSEAAKKLKVALEQSGPKSMRRSSPRDLDGRYRR